MVTGDNLQTAKAIALECGILSSEEEAADGVIIEGRVFRELSETEREETAKRISVRPEFLLLYFQIQIFTIHD